MTAKFLSRAVPSIANSWRSVRNNLQTDRTIKQEGQPHGLPFVRVDFVVLYTAVGVRDSNSASRLASSVSSFTSAAEKPSMPSFSLSVAMRSSACIASNVALSTSMLHDRKCLRSFGIELPRQLAFGSFELRQQLRRYGQQVASGKLLDLADIAEAGAHHLRLVAEFLVIVVDLGHGHARRDHPRPRNPCQYLSCTSQESGRRTARPASRPLPPPQSPGASRTASVRLQWMPSFSSTSAARMPSHVDAILIRMRSRPMPAWSYCAMILRACAMVASVS